MKKDFLDKLCCPFDKHDLDISVFVENTEGDIIEGLFTCGRCKRYYPIVSGIPIMTPDEYRQQQLEAPVMKKWIDKLPGKKMNDFRIEE